MSRFYEIDFERERLGISQKALCFAAGVTPQAYSKWRLNPNSITERTISKLSAALVSLSPAAEARRQILLIISGGIDLAVAADAFTGMLFGGMLRNTAGCSENYSAESYVATCVEVFAAGLAPVVRA